MKTCQTSLLLAAPVALQLLTLPLAAQTATIASAASEDDAVALTELEINSSRDGDSYTAALAASASKSSIPLLQNPQNIQVVPRSLIDDQGAFQLEDILDNVAGVAVGGYYDNWDYFRIRGFSADFNTFIDGLRGGNGLGEETYGLERVEIIKGPASSLFGQGPISGMVNAVSKRPHAARSGELAYTFGNYGYHQVGLDVNSPLDADGALLGRVAAVWRDRESFVDYAGAENIYVAPSLTWRINADTSLTFLGKYADADIVHAMPLPAHGTVLDNPNGKVRSSLWVGEPGANLAGERNYQGGLEFAHRFSSDVTLRQNLRYDYYNQEWFDMLYPGYLSEDQRTLYRYPYDYFQSWHDFAADTRLEIAFDTASLQHNLVAGFDLYRKEYHATYATVDWDPATGVDFIGIDLYDPVYGTAIPEMTAPGVSDTRTHSGGLYVHDHVKFDGGVAVTFGGRYDVTKLNGVRFEEFSPRAGATWEFRRGLTAYASYSESFNAQYGSLFSEDQAAGVPVDPEAGTNLEVGLKSAAADGRLTATISLYQLTRENVATSDPLHPGFVTVTGEQRSRGFEFDGRFKPVPGCDLSVAYAYTHAIITEDNDLPEGARRPGVPLHTFSAWAKYTIQQGALAGFGAGLGGKYYSEQGGDETFAEPFMLPGYTLVDAALYYESERWRVQLNVENVFDREYYEGAYNRLYVLPGEPLTARVTVAMKF
ncbi:MAG: TonB-dependent siderophore receptor [Opitutaceae bacterium]|nr:TonB-dependent siderophore receptor [Opitutaceae bacterium]